MSALTSPTAARRLLLLVALAAVIGTAAGGAAYLLVRLIALLTSLAFFGEWHWGDIPPLSGLEASPRLPIAAVIGAVIVSVMARWAPQIRGHGIPEAMGAVLRNQSRISPRTGLAKPTSAAVAIGTGAPFGAEGPVIVTGGALGSLVGQVLDVTPSERKILLASGAAAGMAATFGAPLASVLLAIELLLFELSVRSLIPLVVSASIAGGIHSAIFGTGPLFTVPVHDYAGLSKFPLYGLLGLACGLLAVLIATGLFRTERLFRSLPIPIFWQPVIGAVVFAGIGLWVPRSLGVGYDAIDDVLAGRLALGALALVLVAKMVSWWVALASGTSGGTLAPILLMSASFGGVFAAIVNEIGSDEVVAPGAFAVVAMAATFGAATRAPFTAIVFVFELTRDFNVILPLMLASVLAALVATSILRESVFTEKLSRRNIRVGGELRVDVLRTTAVADVMNRMVDTVSPDTPVGEVLEQISRGGRGAYPLVEDGNRCVGIVTRSDLLGQQQDPEARVVDAASTDVVTIGPNASLSAALQRMIDERVDHLPVVDGGVLVGICTRADILRVRNEEMTLERVEPGWLAPTLRSRGRRDELSYLVVANQTLGGAALMREIRARSDDERARFHVLVPVAPDGDLATARDRLEQQLGHLADLGVEASGEVGDADPLTAIQEAIRHQPVSEVILSTLPSGASRWLRSDLPSRTERAVEVPVVHVVADGQAEDS